MEPILELATRITTHLWFLRKNPDVSLPRREDNADLQNRAYLAGFEWNGGSPAAVDSRLNARSNAKKPANVLSEGSR
jgi:hypothetical protein